ncbi:MAG: hypothetical protein R6U32_00280, partial [Candidatus Woesearchaeota archaeon]
ATRISLPFTQKLKLLASYALNWGIIGASFFFVVKAFYPSAGYSELPAIVGGYSIVWVIGFLSFLTPGGLGVREGLLTLLLTHMGLVPVSIAVVAPVMMRLIGIIINVLLVAATFKVKIKGPIHGGKRRKRG